ncbi:MAG: GYF domain-containing protein [Myxococcota bacterium]
MKFSCDNCRAQYLIADEKLGRRGVKVRCKKCSYVIIVRPPGFEVAAVARRTGGTATSDFDRSPPSSPPKASPASNSGVPVNDSAPPTPNDGAPIALPPSTPPNPSDAMSPVDRPKPRLTSTPDPAAGLELDQGFGAALGAPVPAPSSYSGRADTTVDGRSTNKSEPAPRPAEQERSSTAGLALDDHIAENPIVEGRSGERLFGERVHTRVTAAPSSGTLKAPIPSFSEPSSDVEDEHFPSQAAGLADGGLLSDEPRAGDDSRSLAGDASEDLTSPDVGGAAAAAVDREAQTDVLGDTHSPSPATSNEASGAAFDQAAESNEAVNDDPVAEEIGHAFAVMFGGTGDVGPNGGADSPPFEDPSVGAQAPPSAEARDSGPNPAAFEWYVAIDDEQVGPISFEDLKTKWQTGTLGPSSLAWRHGMNDWTAIRLIEDLSVLHSPHRPRDAAPSDTSAAIEPPPAPKPAREGPAVSRYPEPVAMHASSEAYGGVEAGSMATMAASSEPAEEEETGWRPSAASALASLAAEEMASPEQPPSKPITDIKVGPALPATTDALERLLEGTAHPRATAFGAAEKSESRVRPLPLQPEAANSVPLRDAVEPPRGPGIVGLLIAILAGFALCGLVVAGIYTFFFRPSTKSQVTRETVVPAAQMRAAQDTAPGVANRADARTATYTPSPDSPNVPPAP